MSEVRNHDLKTFDDLLFRISDEVARSNSALGNELEEGDGTRLDEYFATLETVMKHIQGQPILDLPYTSPQTTWTLKPIPEYAEVTNEHLDHLLRELRIIRSAIPISQSSNKANKFHKKDFARWSNQISKAKNYVNDVIKPLVDQDFPDTGGSGASSSEAA